MINAPGCGVKILINGNPDIVSAEPGSTLGQIIDQLRDFMRSNGLLALNFELDGEELTPERERELAGSDVENYTQMTVEARDVHAACSELLRTVEEAVDPLVASACELAGDLQSGMMQNLESRMQDLLQRFQDIQRGLLMVCGAAGKRADDLMIDGNPFSEKIADMDSIHREMRENIQNADAQALAETLEFELAERLSEWRRAAVVLRETISTADRETDGSD